MLNRGLLVRFVRGTLVQMDSVMALFGVTTEVTLTWSYAAYKVLGAGLVGLASPYLVPFTDYCCSTRVGWKLDGGIIRST